MNVLGLDYRTGNDAQNEQEKLALDYLQQKGLSPEFLIKNKILSENDDIVDFVDDMRAVDERAREMGVQVLWVAEKGPAMAYVRPEVARKTIFFNLVYGTDHRGTLTHEFTHLKQQWVTGDAYNPPGLDDLSAESRTTLYQKAGMANMAVRDVLEGLVEGATAEKHGDNKNVAYTHLQVPEVRKLDAFVFERTGVSLIQCYVEMTKESTERFRQALHEATNQVMLEEAAEEISGKVLNDEQKNHIREMACYLRRDGVVVANSSEATAFVLHTRVPETAKLVTGVSDRVDDVISKPNENYIVLKENSDSGEGHGVNIFGMRTEFADRYIQILREKGSNELGLAA